MKVSVPGSDFEVDMNGKRFAWQGIAKLPFIDQERLLAEVANIEHALREEESRRNSTMPDMLFISLSHKLSPYIFSLDSHCKQLPDNDRIEVKEQIDPVASGGMNGYLSLCVGDPCPTIFRSPIQEMEYIMDNQVICAIYRLPDYHEHIARPPTGVKPPKKTLTVDDLQPEPTLWHEDSGRKPWENGRNEHNRHHDPNGFVSGRQLGDAAQRLVANRLQVKTGRNGNYHQVYDPHPHGPCNYDQSGILHPRSNYIPHNIVRDHPPSNVSSPHYNYNLNYGQPYASSSNRHNRNPQMGQRGFSQSGGRYMNRYQQSLVHCYGDFYVIQTPQVGIASHYGGHNHSGNYSYIATTNHRHQTTGWVPRGNQIGGRGHVPQHRLQHQRSGSNMGGKSSEQYRPYCR